jgi:archaellum biogenesis protein FlaJ (TadC family)
MVSRTLIRFAAHVSVVLYVALLFAEYLRPGFVSAVMNVHAMWFVIVPLMVFAPLDPCSSRNSGPSSAIHWGKIAARFALGIMGLVLALVVWHLGEVFGGMQFWLAVAVGVTPLALSRLRR